MNNNATPNGMIGCIGLVAIIGIVSICLTIIIVAKIVTGH